jgi:hypothetical protein
MIICFAHPITVPLNPHPVPILISASGLRVDKMHGRFTPIKFETGEELNLQLMPMAIRLPGLRRNLGRPEKAQPRPSSTRHQSAANRDQKVCHIRDDALAAQFS